MASREAGEEDRVDGRVERPAPAKINLYLKIVGRRPDGYHDLDSLVAFASIGDRVRVAPADRLSFAVDGRFADDVPSGPSAEDNLAIKAARLLAEGLGRPPAVSIHLHKALPAAAGIGGGSADAAATIRALLALWAVDPPEDRLHALGCRLGADVPVCLAGRSSRIQGIGDRLEPVPALTGVPIVLANPMVAVATPDVFRAFKGPVATPLAEVDPPGGPAALAGWLAAHGNDLQEPAIRLVPAIGTVIEALAGEPGCLLARMSGSGGTCFGLFDSAASAGRAATRLARTHPDWWIENGTLI